MELDSLKQWLFSFEKKKVLINNMDKVINISVSGEKIRDFLINPMGELFK